MQYAPINIVAVPTTLSYTFHMEGFQLLTPDKKIIRFLYYKNVTPETVKAFEANLPFKRILFHAKFSGFEIWTDDSPKLDIPQENVSIYAEPGEIAIGPLFPDRNKISGCIGIFYGEGRLLDGGNIFGKVIEEDFELLKELGDSIWKKGGHLIRFETLDQGFISQES